MSKIGYNVANDQKKEVLVKKRPISQKGKV